ncbi:hypothetical protein CWB73_00930 [Pseudoalteromonas phenolica]|uniref:Uncharacterized protein n=1 Tax=Pseudoalteromonas phenolica TaxID=161398 RepID=A0A5S3YYB3_9GAMM|nr:hypothetical protein [Pseudoalteromonas phenolica]TMN89469.1 hypothetical protein CWB72_10555 [Pseudoalteromonas phenolica]TMP83744.1 hypothetical protein CWB73_00930 [Pseudoalteromonas phenolica]
MVDNKTTYFQLPLPHPENLLQQDVYRIAQSIDGIDNELHQQAMLKQQQAQLLNERLRRVKLNQLLGEPLLTI